MDEFILDHTRQSPALEALRELHRRRPGALLCVEFYADRADELPPRSTRSKRDLRAHGFGYVSHHALDRRRRRASGAARRRRSACRWR